MATSSPRPSTAPVLVGLAVVLLTGLLLKFPCTYGSWAAGRPYKEFCYSDIVPLYRIEGLAGGRVPYFQARNEYPVGQGMFMYLASLPVSSDGGYFLLNAVLLAILAGVTTVSLRRVVGDRAMYFALAPTLLLTGFINWDLLPVALATLGVSAFLRRRDGSAGVLLGLGAASKLFPALFVIAFGLDRLRAGDRRGAAKLAGGAALTWAVVNLPFAAFAFRGWTYFFRFSSARPAQIVTVWSVGCHALAGRTGCGGSSVYNLLSPVAFVAGAVAMWILVAARRPNFPRWSFAYPLLVVFLLTNKAYSPQYDLWLLPWFALVLPDLRLWIAFEVASSAVFFATLSWLGRVGGFGGAPVWLLQALAVARAGVLIACLVAYLRRAVEVDSPVAHASAEGSARAGGAGAP